MVLLEEAEEKAKTYEEKQQDKERKEQEQEDKEDKRQREAEERKKKAEEDRKAEKERLRQYKESDEGKVSKWMEGVELVQRNLREAKGKVTASTLEKKRQGNVRGSAREVYEGCYLAPVNHEQVAERI